MKCESSNTNIYRERSATVEFKRGSSKIVTFAWDMTVSIFIPVLVEMHSATKTLATSFLTYRR